MVLSAGLLACSAEFADHGCVKACSTVKGRDWDTTRTGTGEGFKLERRAAKDTKCGQNGPCTTAVIDIQCMCTDATREPIWGDVYDTSQARVESREGQKIQDFHLNKICHENEMCTRSVDPNAGKLMCPRVPLCRNLKEDKRFDTTCMNDPNLEECKADRYCSCALDEIKAGSKEECPEYMMICESQGPPPQGPPPTTDAGASCTSTTKECEFCGVSTAFPGYRWCVCGVSFGCPRRRRSSVSLTRAAV